MNKFVWLVILVFGKQWVAYILILYLQWCKENVNVFASVNMSNAINTILERLKGGSYYQKKKGGSSWLKLGKTDLFIIYFMRRKSSICLKISYGSHSSGMYAIFC